MSNLCQMIAWVIYSIVILQAIYSRMRVNITIIVSVIIVSLILCGIIVVFDEISPFNQPIIHSDSIICDYIFCSHFILSQIFIFVFLLPALLLIPSFIIEFIIIPCCRSQQMTPEDYRFVLCLFFGFFFFFGFVVCCICVLRFCVEFLFAFVKWIANLRISGICFTRG